MNIIKCYRIKIENKILEIFIINIQMFSLKDYTEFTNEALRQSHHFHFLVYFI